MIWAVDIWITRTSALQTGASVQCELPTDPQPLKRSPKPVLRRGACLCGRPPPRGVCQPPSRTIADPRSRPCTLAKRKLAPPPCTHISTDRLSTGSAKKKSRENRRKETSRKTADRRKEQSASRPAQGDQRHSRKEATDKKQTGRINRSPGRRKMKHHMQVPCR